MCMLQVKFVFWLILIEPRLVLIFFVSWPQDTKEIEDQSGEFEVTPMSFAPLAEVRIPRRNAARAHFAVINKGVRQFYLRSDTR